MRTKRWMLAATVVNGKIYAIGGLGPTRFNAKTLPTVEEYDPVADKWTEKADMPTPGYLLSASSVNGKIYVIGGWAGRAKGPRSTVEEYDPVTDTWTQKADMPTRRSSLSTSVVNGKIYAIGGGQWRKVFSTVEMYDPVTDKWTRKADMPTARAALSTSVVNGKIYVIGGTSVRPGLPLAKVEEFDTGFAVNPAGKLATLWGQIKSAR